MTKENGQENEITFSEKQQAFVDKLIGNARIKAREKAVADAKTAQASAAEVAEQERMAAEKEWQKLAAHHEARVKELEPLEAQVTQFTTLIEGMLKNRVKALGEAAKKAVGALPKGLSLVEKLNWLNANEGLFTADGTAGPVGTPAKKRKLPSGDKTQTPEQMGHKKLRL